MNLQRYNRQTILSGFGKEAQEKLFKTRVLVVGAGGLGCPALQYLAAVGIGNLGIVDFDRIDISNLQRQILFDESKIGELKAEVAKNKLQKMNSEIKIKSYPEKLTIQNAITLIQSYQIIVDCTDNFQVRYLLNDVCGIYNKPLVYGAIYRYEGQVSIFNIEKEGIKTNYRDLFPVPPRLNEVPNCNETGVLGTLSGMVGTFQANEVIKLITGIGEPLIHKLMMFNILNYQTRIINYKKSSLNQSPQTEEELKNMNYEEGCNFSVAENEIKNRKELNIILAQENSILIDVRNEEELPRITTYNYKIIPLLELEEQIKELAKYKTLVFVCQSGIRSLKAMQIMKEKYPDKTIKHIKKGIKTIL